MKARILSTQEINTYGHASNKFIENELARGNCLQKVLNLSDEQLCQFYDYGIELFHAKKFKDAADIFLVLTQLNPYLHNQWLSLGMCEQQKGDLSAAQSAYEAAILLNPSNPLPYVNAALCCLGSEEHETALYFMALMDEMIPNPPAETDPGALAKIKHIKDEIKKSFKNGGR